MGEAMKDDALEAAITGALEARPEVAVPVEFAARLMASLPPQPKVREQRSAGKIAAAAAMAGLVVGLYWLAPHAQPSFESLAFDMEMLMLVELGCVSAWLAMRRT